MIQKDWGTGYWAWEALQLQFRGLRWVSLSELDVKGPRLWLQVRFRGFEVLNKSSQLFEPQYPHQQDRYNDNATFSTRPGAEQTQ